MSESFYPADLHWRAGLPYSQRYDDTYFSVTDPEGERRFVFLQGNSLPQRWLDRNPFTIGDLGFGTGLNLLLIMDAFTHAPWSQMTYVTWELHPFQRDDLAQIHQLWPHLSMHADALARVYPPMVAGIHHIRLSEYRLDLVFVFDDVNKGLEAAPRAVDAWFLDGFAPQRNPSMWCDTLFAALAQASAPGATFATYSAAGGVRRGLSAVGFDVHRVPGFQRKRHMTLGVKATLAE